MYKKKRILIIFLCLCTIFSAACQPTPQEEIIVNKGDGKLMDKIMQTSFPTQSEWNLSGEGGYKVVDHVVDSLERPAKRGKGTITIDADVWVPDVAAFPVVEVAPDPFTQEEADRAIAVFLKDMRFKNSYNDVFTKDRIERILIDTRAELQNVKENTTMPDEMKEESVKEYEEIIKKFEKQYSVAPAEADLENLPVNTKFQDKKYGDGEQFEEVVLVSQETADRHVVGVSNGKGHPANHLGYSRNNILSVCENKDMTQEKAVGIAQELLKNLGYEGLILSRSRLIAYNEDAQVYELSFSQDIKGLQMAVFDRPTYVNGDIEEPKYNETYEPEEIVILVDAKGISGFTWRNRSKIIGVLNENVELVLFSKLWERAKRQLFNSNVAFTGFVSTLNINKIQLSMTRILIKDKPGRYMVVPTWDFIGNMDAFEIAGGQYTPGDHAVATYLTLNAIDGSVIDRPTGN